MCYQYTRCVISILEVVRLDFMMDALCLGNFCPICGLCYSDDDWDCKMIGCSSCESWTHAKCENLPGMYLIVRTRYM